MLGLVNARDRGHLCSCLGVWADAHDTFLKLFLVEPIFKSRSSERPKLPGYDSRYNCGSSSCGKWLCGLVEAAGQWVLLVVSIPVLVCLELVFRSLIFVVAFVFLSKTGKLVIIS